MWLLRREVSAEGWRDTERPEERGRHTHAGHAYNPGDYPDHGTGLFFVGVEATGQIHAYALDHVTGAFTRISGRP